MGKEAENHSSKEKNRNVDLCKEKKITFFLEWGKMSLDKDLLMGDPFILNEKSVPFKNVRFYQVWVDKFLSYYQKNLKAVKYNNIVTIQVDG